MLVIGLTGGIGSGKSTVSAMLAGHGAVVVDMDGLGREVIAPYGRAAAAVVAEFGPGVANSQGHVDRAALAAVVFGQPDALARLTAISHPAINAELGERLATMPASSIVVLDMAILVESNLGRLADDLGYTRVIVVEAPPDVRVERAVARGMRIEDVRARIASQASDEQRRAVADAVVVNDGDLATLTATVDVLWRDVLAWR